MAVTDRPILYSSVSVGRPDGHGRLAEQDLNKKIINDLKEKHHVPRQCRGFFYPFIYIEYISGTIDKIYESSQNNIIHLNDGRYVKWEIRKYCIRSLRS